MGVRTFSFIFALCYFLNMLEEYCIVLAVTAFIRDKDGRILIVHKSLEQRVDGGFWTCPGGKVEPEEGIVDALKREVKEEVGLAIKDYRWIGEDVFESDDRFYHAQHFLCSADGNVVLEDNFLGFEWLKEEDIEKYSFHPNLKKEILNVFEMTQ